MSVDIEKLLKEIEELTECIGKITETLSFINKIRNIPEIVVTDNYFLLTAEMFEKYKDFIPPIDDWWWLASKGNISLYAQCVDENNCVDYEGNNIYLQAVVRPCFKSCVHTCNVGDRVRVYRTVFVYLGDDIFISEKGVTCSIYDMDDNNWNSSYLNSHLQELVKTAILNNYEK